VGGSGRRPLRRRRRLPDVAHPRRPSRRPSIWRVHFRPRTDAMTLLSDRRSRQRYEVLGVLRGTLELSEHVRVQNISGAGALIEMSAPATVGATQLIERVLVGQTTRTSFRVRHVTPLGQAPNTLYHVGVEFVSTPAELKATVASLISEAQTD